MQLRGVLLSKGTAAGAMSIGAGCAASSRRSGSPTARAEGEGGAHQRKQQVDQRPDQSEHQERRDQKVTRPTFGAHVAQLVERDHQGCGWQLDVHPVQCPVEHGPARFDQPTEEPRRLRQGVIGEQRILVDDLWAGDRGDAQPAVADLCRDDEQEAETDSAEGRYGFPFTQR